MIDQNLIAQCREAGSKDYLDGCYVPHSSERLNGLLSHFKKVGESTPYIKAWLAGRELENAKEMALFEY